MTADPPMLQDPAEFAQLLQLYAERQPSRVLEVGVGDGGTLCQWLRFAPRGATVVAIDDQHRALSRYRDWAGDDVQPIAIRGNSADPFVVAEAAGFAPFEWVFLDADHHDQAIRHDWQLYGRLTTPGAVVALHDIAPSSDPTIEVAPLWAELKAEQETLEFLEPGGFGIGVVLLPELEEATA